MNNVLPSFDQNNLRVIPLKPLRIIWLSFEMVVISNALFVGVIVEVGDGKVLGTWIVGVGIAVNIEVGSVRIELHPKRKTAIIADKILLIFIPF